MSTLADRLREAMQQQGKRATDVAEVAGLTKGALSLILHGKTITMKPDNAIKIANFLHCDPVWLLTGDAGRPVRAYEDADDPPDGMVVIKEFNVKLAAGCDYPDPTYEEEHDSRPTWYHEDFFRRLGIKPENCKRLKVSGDSMEPLINDGDWVLVDTTKGQTVIDGEIYAFCQCPGGLRVKRVFKPLKGGMVIHSDNPRYADEYYDNDTQVNFYLVGRVLERSGSIV